MFSRIKGAIDRTLAEEQARHSKTLAEQRASANSPASSSTASVSRTNSNVKRSAKKPSQDIANTDNAVNPDPAVFEAAFVLDDDDPDNPSRSATPKPAVASDKGKKESTDDAVSEKKASAQDQNGDVNKTTGTGSTDKPSESAATTPAPPELPSQVKTKLKKLEKLEATYPDLLRSYRIAHGRATSIEPFERVLRENTPLTTIKDLAAFVDYLNELRGKGDMIMEEYKRVSADKEGFKKKFEDADAELATLKDEIATLKAGKIEEAATRLDESKDGKATEKGDEGEDMFSYDDEIPKLQAELSSKAEEITRLTSEIGVLKQDLAVAKESSASLAEDLEKATRELSESQDKSAAQVQAQAELDKRNTEIKSLTETIKQTQDHLRDVEVSLEKEKSASTSMLKEKDAKLEVLRTENQKYEFELKNLSGTNRQSSEKINSLTVQIEAHLKSKAESETRLQELTKQLQSGSNATGTTQELLSVPSATAAPTSPTTTTASKKKNKKKKKGGASIAPAVETTPSETSEQPQPSPLESPDTEALRLEVAKLKDEIVEKDSQIDRLSKQRKTEEDLREEIESLQGDLIDIGQTHVEAKEKIKELENEKKALKSRISDLEKELASSTAEAASNIKLQAEYDSMKKEFDQLKTQSRTLESDLGAAQKIAQDRFKDLTNLKEVLAKAQPELKSLRQKADDLETTREELGSKQNELRALEKREKDLKNEVNRVQRLSSDRESEIRLLNDRLAAEKLSRTKLEDEKRTLGRDFRRSEAEKIEISAKAEKADRELEAVRSELSILRPKVKQLEDELAKLNKEKGLAKEEIDFKTQQYNNAQGLLASMRDQITELSVQLKEARNQADSLEEELAEVQKHLSERTREGETMRRMMADVNERTDAKVRDMKSRMEAAIEDRDRMEDESSTLARRRAREAEELKNKVRELEREVKALTNEKDDLEAREREWRRRREELEQDEERVKAEAEDMRSTVSSLRSALDASEQQVHDVEKKNADLRKLLDEARSRYERANKELKSIQSRLNVASGPNMAGSVRSSIDSTRSGLNGSPSKGAPGGPDTAYLKTIFLQFLEVKDEKVRSQLVPVLGKLLGLDKNEEQRWLSAIHHLSKSSK